MEVEPRCMHVCIYMHISSHTCIYMCKCVYIPYPQEKSTNLNKIHNKELLYTLFPYSLRPLKCLFYFGNWGRVPLSTCIVRYHRYEEMPCLVFRQTKDDLGLMILPPTSPVCRDYRQGLPYLNMQYRRSRASCMLGKRSTNWTTSPVLHFGRWNVLKWSGTLKIGNEHSF